MTEQQAREWLGIGQGGRLQAVLIIDLHDKAPASERLGTRGLDEGG